MFICSGYDPDKSRDINYALVYFLNICSLFNLLPNLSPALQSQLDFNMTSALPEQPISTTSSSIQADPKPAKVAQSSQLAKGTPSSKPSNGEGPSLGSRQEEESSFWKISAERSRLDGEKANCLTPSQIKSLEKGEKPLPSYLRPETPSSDRKSVV